MVETEIRDIKLFNFIRLNAKKKKLILLKKMAFPQQHLISCDLYA